MGKIERTLVFVKPRNEEIAHVIFDYLNFLLRKNGNFFQKFGLTWELNCVAEDLIAEHYKYLREVDENVFKATVEAYKIGKIFLTFYSGEEIIQRVRRNVGDTAPEKAEPWTVRGRFKRDSLEDAFREKRYCNNVIHASKNEREARRELDLWLPFLADLES